MNNEMIEFTKDWTSCWKVGDRFRRDSRPQFAAAVVNAGYAKAIKMPPKNKMVSDAANKR